MKEDLKKEGLKKKIGRLFYLNLKKLLPEPIRRVDEKMVE